MSNALRARVKGGRLVLDEPCALPGLIIDPLGETIRVLTSTETSTALTTLERIDRPGVESAVRQVLLASRSVGEQRRNPFTGNSH